MQGDGEKEMKVWIKRNDRNLCFSVAFVFSMYLFQENFDHQKLF